MCKRVASLTEEKVKSKEEAGVVKRSIKGELNNFVESLFNGKQLWMSRPARSRLSFAKPELIETIGSTARVLSEAPSVAFACLPTASTLLKLLEWYKQ